ncbi:MAG TPA: ATP-dependent helicase HrpB [Myxococcales bacterium]|nr:ATP-dependent helicase HrpB [Myxococcales bacterium]
MGIHQVTSAVAPAGASPVEPKQPFGKMLEKAQPPSPSEPLDPHRARAGVAQAAARAEAARPAEATAARAVDQVAQAQHRLDRVLALAQSGRTFSPAELLGLQAQVYSASQQLDLAGKAVEKATSGVKQVLQTQI